MKRQKKVMALSALILIGIAAYNLESAISWNDYSLTKISYIDQKSNHLNNKFDAELYRYYDTYTRKKNIALFKDINVFKM